MVQEQEGDAPLALISRPEASSVKKKKTPEASKCRNLQSRMDTAETRMAALCGTVFVLTPNSTRQEKGSHS